MKHLVANISGKVRRVSEGGKSYLVAPSTLIVPGVLAGSKGPLLYRPDDIRRSAPAWNGMPLVIYHPHDPITNQPLSAQDPEQGPGVLEKQGVGEVRKSRFTKKHQAEAWFDEDRLKKVSPVTHKRLLAGEQVELSTGLFTDNVEEAGSFNGKPYVAVATNFRPDHLAVLPDQLGACSIKDGCGILVNKKQTFVINPAWVEDHDIWEKAKAAADKGDYDDDSYYAVVTSIYKKMGGGIKSSTSNTLAAKLVAFNSNPEGTNQYTGASSSVKKAAVLLRKYRKMPDAAPLSLRAINASDKAVTPKDHAKSAKMHLTALKSAVTDHMIKAHKELARYHQSNSTLTGNSNPEGINQWSAERHAGGPRKAQDRVEAHGKYTIVDQVNPRSLARGKVLEYSPNPKPGERFATTQTLGKAQNAERLMKVAEKHHQGITATRNSASEAVMNKLQQLIGNSFSTKLQLLANSNPEGCNQYKDCGGMQQPNEKKITRLHNHIFGKGAHTDESGYGQIGGGGWVSPKNTHDMMQRAAAGENPKALSKEYFGQRLKDAVKDESGRQGPNGRDSVSKHAKAIIRARRVGDTIENVLNGKLTLLANSNPEGINQYTGGGSLPSGERTGGYEQAGPGEAHRVSAELRNKSQKAGIKLGRASRAAFVVSDAANTPEEHLAAAKVHEGVASKTGKENLYDLHKQVAAAHLKQSGYKNPLDGRTAISGGKLIRGIHNKLTILANSNDNRDELGRFASGSGGSKGSGKGSAKVHRAAKEGHAPDLHLVGSLSDKAEKEDARQEKLQTAAQDKIRELRQKEILKKSKSFYGGTHNMSSTLQAKLTTLLSNSNPEGHNQYTHGGGGSGKVHGAAKSGHKSMMDEVPEMTAKYLRGEGPTEVFGNAPTEDDDKDLSDYAIRRRLEDDTLGPEKKRELTARLKKMDASGRYGRTENQGTHNMSSTLQAKLTTLLSNSSVENADVLEDASVVKLKKATEMLPATDEDLVKDDLVAVSAEDHDMVTPSSPMQCPHCGKLAVGQDDGVEEDNEDTLNCDKMTSNVWSDEARAAAAEVRKSKHPASVNARKMSLAARTPEEHEEAADAHYHAADEHRLDEDRGKSSDEFVKPHMTVAAEHLRAAKSLRAGKPANNRSTSVIENDNQVQQEGGLTMATVTLNAEEREAVVNGLIGGECCFEEDEREVLNTLSDRTLARLTLNAKEMPKFIQDKIDAKAAKEEGSDEEEADETDDEEAEENAALSSAAADGDVKPMGELNPKAKDPPTKNQLSAEDRQFLAIGRKVIADRRGMLINTITANSRNPFDKKELAVMNLDQLEKLGQLAQVENKEPAPAFTLNRFANYMGASAGIGNVNGDDGTDDDILPLPVMNWKEPAKV